MFKNDLNHNVLKILKVQNPLLEEVTLYNELGDILKKSGMLHIDKMQTTIEPSFLITFKPKSSKTYYLKIKNNTTALRFAIMLEDPELFLYNDHLQQTLVMLSLGIIIALFLYNTLLYIYVKEISYLYYSLYLATLVLQQLTYLGITPLFFPTSFIHIDNLSVVFKVNIMYILAALFAKEFLQTKKYPIHNFIYNLIIIVAVIEIPLFGTPWFYYPEIGILTGLIFVLFNIYAAIYIYNRGHKQARFFIAGWSVLVIGFVLMIADGLGIVSIMYKMPNFILYATILEALLLSLAFTDRYVLLQKQKEKSDRLLVESLENRQAIIEAEIKRQTKVLFNTLESKKTLLKELHHRTKNNLQLILSIVRMQIQTVPLSSKILLKSLAGRIIAIAKTYEMLYLKDNLQKINMDDYIKELCENISQSFHQNKIIFHINATDIDFPLKEASYIGLLVNETVINSIKYANTEKLTINISLYKKENEYFLRIQDNGKGYCNTKEKQNSLGTSLIKTLVQNQLEGDLSMETTNGVSYVIRFKL